MDLDQIIDSVLKERGKDQIGLVVLTGGEPVRQPIHLLVIHLISKGFTVQVETAGTLWNECLRLCKVVVSPKTAILNEKIQEVAFAFKYIIRCTDLFASEDGLPLSSTQKKEEKIKLARPKYPEIPIFLSPCDEYDVTKNKANLQACIARGIQHGYIVGIQLHKYLGLQ
jgi:organic radical activating enzyme